MMWLPIIILYIYILYIDIGRKASELNFEKLNMVPGSC